MAHASLDPSSGPPLRIRTITAGRELASPREIGPIEEDLAFLATARDQLLELGLEVQTIRLATQPLVEAADARALAALQRMDSLVSQSGALLAIGPLREESSEGQGIADWAAELMQTTSSLSFSLSTASPRHEVDLEASEVAARIMLALAASGERGEANFRFAAAAHIPAGTPFFPVAFHAGEPAFSIGLESARLVELACQGAADTETARARLTAEFETRLAPLVAWASQLAREHSRRFLGIDMSPAPGLDASIAVGIEMLSGVPFGSPSTLAACSTITAAISAASLPKCGYSGLMLPVLEDLRLAERAAEGRFSLNDLLLYSAVCGTGLDVVPLPGDITVDSLAAIVADVASLAHRLRKPLAARLLPIPGKLAGEIAEFDNPYLTDAMVMPVR